MEDLEGEYNLMRTLLRSHLEGKVVEFMPRDLYIRFT